MPQTQPLVSIICTCYNHELFIEDALKSVIDQTYSTIELIVINDSSSDGSLSVIESVLSQYPKVPFVNNVERMGLCKNFNRGLSMSFGKYILDLSGDDELQLDKIERQVDFLESLDSDFGVAYSNAEIIDVNGNVLGFSYPVDLSKKAEKRPPEGDIYLDLIKRYAIATQTMMMRRETLEEMGGYDENLAYEDFDFWIRSSRTWKYAYQDEILMKIRETPGSLSSKQYDQDDQQLRSTFEVCKKIKTLNRTEQEDQALIQRLKYEIKHAVLAEKRHEARLFIELLADLQRLSTEDKFFKELNSYGVKTAWIRDAVLQLKTKN